jgi:hypothetical protein
LKFVQVNGCIDGIGRFEGDMRKPCVHPIGLCVRGGGKEREREGERERGGGGLSMTPRPQEVSRLTGLTRSPALQMK